MAKTKTNRLVATSLVFLLATLAPSFALTSGNTIYVPIYSHVYHGNVDWTKKSEVKQRIDLSIDTIVSRSARLEVGKKDRVGVEELTQDRRRWKLRFDCGCPLRPEFARNVR